MYDLYPKALRSLRLFPSRASTTQRENLLSALEELRARIGALETGYAREQHAFSLYPAGLPKGGLVEIAGHGKTECAVRFLAEHPGIAVAWIEGEFSLFPTALLQRRVDPAKILFIEGKKDAGWAAGVILRSGLFPFVIYHAPYKDERELRRFQLLSEKARSTTILLQEKPSGAWPITLHLELKDGRLEARRRR